MLFNSFLFVFAFLPVTLVGYFMLNRWGRFTLGKLWLILLSFVFYAYANPRYLPIILISILFNYALSRCMHVSKQQWLRLSCLLLGLIINLGVLGYYKYCKFFINNINAAFGTSLVPLELVLPLGISFFTFQQLSYIIDSYKRAVPRYTAVDYSLFIAFFPNLVAGPIVLHGELVPQFADPANRRFRADNFAPGLYAFALGLAKKVLIADTFAKVTAYGFAPGAALSSTDAILTILAFTFQLYFDFSGYCDMALGLGRMFNIHLPLNFNSPYKSLDIKEFWTRWHITLSRFFMRYVYIPLGGSRKGEPRVCLNLLIVFLISGLWHGAGWMFLLWGLMHGVASVLYRLCGKQYDRLPKALRWLLTFAFVCVAWVFFRAESLDVALNILRSAASLRFALPVKEIASAFSFPFNMLGIASPYLLWVWFIGALLAVTRLRNTSELTDRFEPNRKTGIYTFILLALSILSLSGVSVFLYYNF